MERETDAILRDGYSISSLLPADSQLLAETLHAALKFFRLDEEIKRRDYFPGHHVGYRYSGIEYSATPDRPDLNDSINISWNWQELVSKTSAAMDFYCTADRLMGELDRIAQSILTDVARRYGVKHEPPETRRHSWLQVNYYRSFPEMREVLQDKHEDGHLLTLWNSQKPGLEMFSGDSEAGIPVTLDAEHMLIMPGGLLTMLTGGDIDPLYHRVVRSEGANQRLALMYFVNPATEQPLFPYKIRADESVEDIAAAGARNPEKYGLPQLKAGEAN